MTGDPITDLARQRCIEDSLEIENQLLAKTGARPIISMLAHAREEASNAFRRLVEADPEDSKTIRTLQFEVRRFDDLVRWLRDIVSTGVQFSREISDDERDYIQDLLKPAHDMEYDEEDAEEEGYVDG
jgi:hypothetical protein